MVRLIQLNSSVSFLTIQLQYYYSKSRRLFLNLQLHLVLKAVLENRLPVISMLYINKYVGDNITPIRDS